MVRLKEILFFHTLHPAEATGVQIHPFKVVSAGSRASWASTSSRSKDLFDKVVWGRISHYYTLKHTHTYIHTHTGLISAGTSKELNLHPGINKTEQVVWGGASQHSTFLPSLVSAGLWGTERPHSPRSETEWSQARQNSQQSASFILSCQWCPEGRLSFHHAAPHISSKEVVPNR